jgi:hypothetical protein
MTAPRFRIVIKIGRWVLAIGIGEQIPADQITVSRQIDAATGRFQSEIRESTDPH